MTDVHCHVSCGDPSVREFIVGRDFFGTHPWDAASGIDITSLKNLLLEHPESGVGEIGLDRLHDKTISPEMRNAFETQLSLALELHRPAVLHGAKCWGQVVATVKRLLSWGQAPDSWGQAPVSWGQAPVFLFHGFSRSDGLIPDIVSLNGYISVGPAVLNDHAVNYRELVKKIPADRLLLETDRTVENAAKCPKIGEILVKTSQIRGVTAEELEASTDENAARFRFCVSKGN